MSNRENNNKREKENEKKEKKEEDSKIKQAKVIRERVRRRKEKIQAELETLEAERKEIREKIRLTPLATLDYAAEIIEELGIKCKPRNKWGVYTKRDAETFVERGLGKKPLCREEAFRAFAWYLKQVPSAHGEYLATWASPGSGKSFFLSEIACTIGEYKHPKGLTYVPILVSFNGVFSEKVYEERGLLLRCIVSLLCGIRVGVWQAVAAALDEEIPASFTVFSLLEAVENIHGPNARALFLVDELRKSTECVPKILTDVHRTVRRVVTNRCRDKGVKAIITTLDHGDNIEVVNTAGPVMVNEKLPKECAVGTVYVMGGGTPGFDLAQMFLIPKSNEKHLLLTECRYSRDDAGTKLSVSDMKKKIRLVRKYLSRMSETHPFRVATSVSFLAVARRDYSEEIPFEVEEYCEEERIPFSVAFLNKNNLPETYGPTLSPFLSLSFQRTIIPCHSAKSEDEEE